MTFIFLFESDNGEWVDTDFSDTSARRDLRQWRLSVNIETGETYGTLMRAATADSGFEHSVQIPRKLVTKLMESL